MDELARDERIVFVVHGRNDQARNALFEFLRALDLKPLEWSAAVALTGSASPYIGEVLDRAFRVAQAVIVLLTPDEIAYLRPEYASGETDPDLDPAAQARPNVLFEAGMAFGRHPDRTVLVEMGSVRPFSDIAGRHVVRMDGSPDKRNELATRLKNAGCKVETGSVSWLTAGNLLPPSRPGSGLPLGRRLPSEQTDRLRIDATYRNRSRGKGVLQITNHSPFDIHDLSFEIPQEAGPSFHVDADLPMKKLPSGKSASFNASRFTGNGADHFEITITGRTPDGDPVSVPSFISLVG